MRTLFFALLIANLAFMLWRWSAEPVTSEPAPSPSMVSGLKQLAVISEDAQDSPKDDAPPSVLSEPEKAPQPTEQPASASVDEPDPLVEQELPEPADEQRVALDESAPLVAPVPEPEPEPEPEPVALAEEQCLTLGPVSDEQDAVTFVSGLQPLLSNVLLTSEEQPDRPVLWVHVPPLASAAEADQAVERLAARGIESFRIREPERLANGISLGVFRVDERAERAVEGFAGLGYPVEVDRSPRTQTVYRISARMDAAPTQQHQELKTQIASLLGEVPYELADCEIAESAAGD